MGNVAIRAEGLGKAYQISHRSSAGGYRTIRDDLMNMLKRPFRRIEDDPTREIFWALKDISFELKNGQVLGIIGHNGAGKSTLLKILSRITRPTEGHADVYGRVGSLLEVGTGFHPELTGRENIFLNGAVLGMTRGDITRRFDEIVDFAEVEQFIDTPVKRYSSGMYVRLAFAVAAHLEPEVLIIDEVLAVGDIEFQRKCLGKMESVAGEGRTVIFVSHNMSAVRNLCSHTLVLDHGNITFEGNTESAIDYYVQNLVKKPDYGENPYFFEDKPDLIAQIQQCALRNEAGEYTTQIDYTESFTVDMTVELRKSDPNYYCYILLLNSQGDWLVFTTDEDSGPSAMAGVDVGSHTYSVAFPKRMFAPGIYYLTVTVARRPEGKIDRLDNAIKFEIVDEETWRAMRGLYRNPSMISPELSWQIVTRNETSQALE